MGLLKAGVGVASGVLADSWREYFYVDSLESNVLAVKGKKRTSRRSSNTKGEDNIISNGSIIAINEGQCMLIIEQGKVVDRNIGLDIDISIRCNGEYSYKIVDPMLFYSNVCGNITEEFTRDKIDSQLKTELMTALQPAFAKISEMGIRYSAIPDHTLELSEALNEALSKKWTQLRGIAVYSFGVNTVKASEEEY